MRVLAAVLVGVMVMPGAAQKAVKPADRAKVAAAPKTGTLIPLSERERVQQMLDRFTFGARPGEVEQVAALGADAWFEQQLNPAAIKDDVTDRRINDYPVLRMQPQQVVQQFPAQFVVQQVAEGKIQPPTDPMLASAYEVQIFRYRRNLADKKVDADGKSLGPTDDELALRKTNEQATAQRIAGQLFAVDRAKRMAALMQMPAEDRAAFTQYVAGDQKNILLGEFNPRERELFYAMAGNVGSSYRTPQELSEAKVIRMVTSERQLQEMMTDFWMNHFNVFAPKDSDQWYISSYERDVIRPRALGKFKDLLLATVQSPAMMVYLDNFNSIGPNSEANGGKRKDGKRNGRGMNENYAREVMELHTVGVNGGYTQADVTALAAVLTGWSVDQPNLGGKFIFDPKKHEPGEKTWFGQTIADDGTQQGDFQQGVIALTKLAEMPQTAHFISWKLAQRFVADDPPAALVDAMAKTFADTDGDIKEMLRTMVHSKEFSSKKYFRNKVKMPEEFVASTFRATGTDVTNPGAVVQTLKQMGMPLYGKLEPTGYYVTAEQWMNTTALVDRLNFSIQLAQGKYAGHKFDASRVLALGLMSQPVVGVQPAGIEVRNAGGAKAVKISESSTMPVRAINSGMDVAMDVLEKSMVGGPVSAKTNDLIRQQMDQSPDVTQTGPVMTPSERLNMLTALVMGSPEFQLR